VFLQNCNDARISGVQLQNSGFWNLHLYHCRNVEIDGISITAPHGDRPEIVDVETPWDEISVDRAPSSDGIDVDSCQNVTIRNSRISVGDDCIALKGTKGPTALDDESSPPVENIRVEDCVLANGHGVLTCGSEATIIRNIQIRRCQVGAGIPLVRLKLRPDTPQLYENFLVEDIQLDDAQALFDVKPWTQFFDLQGHDPPASRVRNIVVKNISGSLQSLGELRGNDGDVIENIVLQEIDVEAREARFSVGDVQRLVLEDVRVNGEEFSVE
jgi:alpha-L-rhamnosidase